MKTGRWAFLLLSCLAAGSSFMGCAPASGDGNARVMTLDADIWELGGFPGFDQSETEYATTVPLDASNWTLSVTIKDEAGNKVKKYKDSMALSVGRNTYSVIVPYISSATSEKTTKRYTVAIHKPRYVSPCIGNLMRVPAGTFQRDERSGNLSVVSEFAMGQHEITENQFWAVMGYDNFAYERPVGPSMPVRGVNWYEAIVFCNRLSLSEGLKPCYSVASPDFPDVSLDRGIEIERLSIEKGWFEGAPDPWWQHVRVDYSANGYRLPTYFEWTWAAMGADSSAPGEINRTGYRKTYAGSDGPDRPNRYVIWREEHPYPVGTKLPNELGLYDMTGNVAEWLTDMLDLVKPSSDPMKPPMYPDLEGRVVDNRGKESAPGRTLAPSRYSFTTLWSIMLSPLVPTALYRDFDLGFRVVRR